MYKSSILVTVTAVAVVIVLLAMQICDGSENVFTGCDVPPQFWCSSEQLARKCQVGSFPNVLFQE